MYAHADYKADPMLAVREVGRLLGSGSLNLIVGAGGFKGIWPSDLEETRSPGA